MERAHACDANKMFAGPSGGGGGAGGCGGAPGNPGTSGGSSIGILALGAKPMLTTVSITAHDGGAGALAPAGSSAGTADSRASARRFWCVRRRSGGQGGAGGPGGGGAGGHSVAIAIKGANAARPEHARRSRWAAAGWAGGGDMDMTAQTKGDGGMACKTLDFTPMATTPCGM